jgi:hypothetical protein
MPHIPSNGHPRIGPRAQGHSAMPALLGLAEVDEPGSVAYTGSVGAALDRKVRRNTYAMGAPLMNDVFEGAQLAVTVCDARGPSLHSIPRQRGSSRHMAGSAWLGARFTSVTRRVREPLSSDSLLAVRRMFIRSRRAGCDG